MKASRAPGPSASLTRARGGPPAADRQKGLAERIARIAQADWRGISFQALIVAIIIGLALAAHWAMFRDRYAMLGYDTYLQIIASRIESFRDLMGTFTENLTDGRIRGVFYRPVQNISIALDYALSGLDPIGYHISSFAVLLAGGVLIYFTARRILGGAAWIGAAIAAIYFVLHPTLLNVVPMPCRRSESLTVVFLMAALLVLPIGREPKSWRPYWLAALFTLLASGAKELGVMAVGLVFLHQFFLLPQGGLLKTIRRAALVTLPSVGAAAVYLINRTIVVRGMGGYQQPRDDTYMERQPEFMRQLYGELLGPWSMLGMNQETTALVATLLLAALAVLFVALGLRRREGAMRRPAVLILLGMAWLFPPTIVIGLSKWCAPWYATLPLGGLALIVAGVGHGIVELLRGPKPWRGWAPLPAGMLALVLAASLRWSPLFVRYDELQEGTRLLNETLRDVDRNLAKLRGGQGFMLTVTPRVPVLEDAGRPPLRWITLSVINGVQAYADMRYPYRKPRVLGAQGVRAPQSADEVLILVRYTASPVDPDTEGVRGPPQ